ncbi:MAG: DNA-processing protein DprA [Candidatus Dormibacteraeota bacterium]|nr:DNA-processing protein DprA [Candidatus Dormibacteraeota bacterium]
MSGALPVRRLGRGEPGWPERLEHLDCPPRALFVRGSLPPGDGPCVAVIGSRRPTPGGLLIARDIAADLAAAGVAVVSGMARGIDGAAHRGALHGGGGTIAVLGCGIDVCYPTEHLELREQIAAHGSVVSEDGGSEPPIGWRFPQRNRIIAALAEAVVVVEATARSGALSTARWAADLGREVLAVPGSIRNPSSAGTNFLIRDGVRPYLGIADLFEAVPHLRRGLAASSVRPVAGAADAHLAAGDALLGRILDELTTDPVHPDDLAAALGVGAVALGPALTTLQLRGAVTDVCGGRVARTF